MSDEKVIRSLVIKTFHINKVEFSKKTYIENKVLYIRDNIKDCLIDNEQAFIKDITIDLIYPDNHDMFVNSIMDFSPIATKVLGKMGEGITHALTGVYVMLTGVDETGIQVAEFGSSEGILKEQVVFGRAGTPSKDDIIIHVDVTLKEGMGIIRDGINSAHRACDKLVQEIRDYLKKMNGRLCDERYEYSDIIRPEKKKVVIIKQVAGQGAMYDTLLFAKEPGGFEGGRSIIDMGNVPIIVSPNEYRDGALRAMH
ncbi:D-proline reductase (dithiol) PrdD [Caloramator quimbayensis]|uniref:D-proline reductase (Dithiol) PrdD n=1 Tax=Caloramator quimbayensis TaxID=1147123 RepID=A0A1T4XSN1_9CLOT|nr:proline reductase cluster protein PrdD [Caloramator quimbayensis]SKA92557.1 D-proline reductase (dithiol) PrdD [Caloramator quimbayensis]